jgi:hypothetical protein
MEKSASANCSLFNPRTISIHAMCSTRIFIQLSIPDLWVTSEKTIPTVLLWLSAGILSIATNFSTEAYLIVIATFILSAIKSNNIAKFQPISDHR